MIGLICCFTFAGLSGSFGSRLKHDPTDHPPKEAFYYKGYDGAGKVVIRGWIVINLHDSTLVDGEWCLDRVGDPDNIGPQIGLGSLRGRLDEALLTVSLNPGFMDFNVSLAGTFDGSSYKGTWRYSTIKGTVSEGAFEASKKVEANAAT